MPRPKSDTPPTKRRPSSDHQNVVGLRSVGALESDHVSTRSLSPLLRRSRFSSAPHVEVRHGEGELRFPSSVELPRRHVAFYTDSDSESSHSGGGLCSMSDVLEGNGKDGSGSPNTQPSVRIKHAARSCDGASRFPKLDECAHFHYDNVELGPIEVTLLEDRPADQSSRNLSIGDATNSSSSGSESLWCMRVISNGKTWEVKRSLDNFLMLDRQLHCCVYERKFSGLIDLTAATKDETDLQKEDARVMLTEYLERFSQLAESIINCGPVLNWLELDNRGYRLIVTDEAAINTPAVAAAYVTKRYAAQVHDEIHLEVGDIISVIDMPPPDESTWWRGKKGFQVGFFPCECVEIIGDKIPQTIKIPKVPAKPVLRKHGKLIAFFRQFLLSRPSRRKLKQSGILKERVFGCDLGEHLMNSGRDIPLVLKCCSEFIEEFGIVDGIYRLSGVTSNIQKLRLAFDEDRAPNLMDEAIIQDIHCVASLLKMYFRELPNPLLTFHLYDKFVHAVQAEESIRLLKLRDVVQQLPPPHYRSLEYLMRHLSKVAAYGAQTGMTPKNVAIVWAPNLLRSREIENGGVGALHVVGVQAVLTEYLIRYKDIIFSDKMPVFPSPVYGDETPRKIRPKSLAISTPTKLLSLEEARSRALASNCPVAQPKFIEVGGGAETLPTKYHTIIDIPGRRSGGKGKKSPQGWRSFFSRGWHTTSGRSKARRNPRTGPRPKISSPIFMHHSPFSSQDKAVTESEVSHLSAKKLRTVKSAESLLMLEKQMDTSDDKVKDLDSPSQPSSTDPLSHQSPNNLPKSPTYQKHTRSTSHDSYFEHLDLDSSRESEDEFALRRMTLPPVDSGLSDNVEMKVTDSETTQSEMEDSSIKQKLVSFESAVPSPKKLNLKRVHHALSSPPMVRKKGSTTDSGASDDNRQRKTKARRTNFDDKESKAVIESGSELSGAVSLFSDDSTSMDADVKEVCLEQVGVDDDFSRDCLMSVSVEATLSGTIGVSQLQSFESKDGMAFSPGITRDDTYDAFSAMPLDNSVDTQDSPTTDNVSDMPSSAGSELSCSPGDVDKQMPPMDRSIRNGQLLDVKVVDRICAQVKQRAKSEKIDIEDILSQQTSSLQIDGSFPMEVLNPPAERTYSTGSPCVDDNLILSPPENFGNSASVKSPLEKKETCDTKNILFIPDTGKDLNSAIQDWCDSALSNKKKVNDRVSPISPVEESRRRFESEIGRLIVRDRQMRLEMEQMKAERQKCNNLKPNAFGQKSNELSIFNSKCDKKSVAVPELKKSPVKRLLEVNEAFSMPKESQEPKKAFDWSSPTYPQYMRMDNKPSVKELLSKFEAQPKSTVEVSRSPPKCRSSIFSNVQVINHDSKNTTADGTDEGRTTESCQHRDHIFQTECVVRFPHPKGSSIFTSSFCSPQHKLDNSPTFLNSYLRSRSDLRHTMPLRKTPAKANNGIHNTESCSPREPKSSEQSPLNSGNFEEDVKPSVKLKKKFLEDFGPFDETSLSGFGAAAEDAPDDGLRTSVRRLKPSPSKQRPRSVPPSACRFSITSSVRPSAMQAMQVPNPGNNVPNKDDEDSDDPQSSQNRPQTRRGREKTPTVERSYSFSGYADRKGFTIAPSPSQHFNKANGKK